MNIYLSYHPLKLHTVSYLNYIVHNTISIYKNDFFKNGINVFDIPAMYREQNMDCTNKIKYHDFFINFVKFNINLKEINLFFGYAPIGFDVLFNDRMEKVINKKCFRIMWQDDLHSFYKKKTDIFLEKDFNREELKDYRLDKADIILTPSIQFMKNCKINYLNKCIFYFYAIDPRDEYFYKLKPFNERKNKILLSGNISKKNYPSRFFVEKNIQNKKSIYKDYFEQLQHPGYIGKGNCDENKIWYNYYNIIQEYKFSFIGLAKNPLNFLLSKIIETMACGTLAIIEETSLLSEELGLVEGIHYVGVKFENDVLDITEEKIKNIIIDKDGKYRKIAENGHRYVMTNINLNKNYKIILNICNYFKKKNNNI